MERNKLSIIILSFNTEELLKKCLVSISEQTIKNTDIEIIIVDNASSDNSVKMVNDFRRENSGLEIKLVENKRNVGFAAGNNQGLKVASGQDLLFLNSDTELKTQALESSLAFLASDLSFGALTPKTLLATGKIDLDCHRGFPTPWASITYFLGLERLFPKSKIFAQYHKTYLDLDSNHEIDAGAGAFLLVKKNVIDKIGYWDEQYFFYGEDLDYFYRIKQAGYKVVYFAQPLLIHHKGASSGLRKESQKITTASKENKIKVAKASIKAMEIFYKKFYQDLYPGWLTFLVLLAIRLKGFLRLAKQYF